MKQKEIFLESEGDEWFKRNLKVLSARKHPDSDPLLEEIIRLPQCKKGIKVLEIGCGDGGRLEWMQDHLGFECYGLDPSNQAIMVAKSRGISCECGTADHLPFDDNMFDVVVFGFCLYLCDREDLFRIASEVDRVLNSPGWLLIMDFYSPIPLKKEYHHRKDVYSYKMDYRTLFTWHPSYSCFSHRVISHTQVDNYTDNTNEWVSISVLRKKMENCFISI